MPIHEETALQLEKKRTRRKLLHGWSIEWRASDSVRDGLSTLSQQNQLKLKDLVKSSAEITL